MEDSSFRERFSQLVENMDDSDLIALWNNYAEENCSDDFIYENEKSVIDEFFSSAHYALERAFYGNYNPNNDYMWFNTYGNIETSNYIDEMPIDIDALADYVQDSDFDLLLNYGVSEEDINSLFEIADEEDENEEEDEEIE